MHCLSPAPGELTHTLLLATTAHEQTHAGQPQCPHHNKPTSLTHSPSVRDIIYIYFLGFPKSDCQCFSPLTPNHSYHFFKDKGIRCNAVMNRVYIHSQCPSGTNTTLRHDILSDALFQCHDPAPNMCFGN